MKKCVNPAQSQKFGRKMNSGEQPTSYDQFKHIIKTAVNTLPQIKSALSVTQTHATNPIQWGPKFTTGLVILSIQYVPTMASWDDDAHLSFYPEYNTPTKLYSATNGKCWYTALGKLGLVITEQDLELCPLGLAPSIVQLICQYACIPVVYIYDVSVDIRPPQVNTLIILLGHALAWVVTEPIRWHLEGMDITIKDLKLANDWIMSKELDIIGAPPKNSKDAGSKGNGEGGYKKSAEYQGRRSQNENKQKLPGKSNNRSNREESVCQFRVKGKGAAATKTYAQQARDTSAMMLRADNSAARMNNTAGAQIDADEANSFLEALDAVKVAVKADLGNAIS